MNIGAKSIRGGARMYDVNDIKKFENVFSHRVLRPFYIVYSESETSTWLSFVRLVVGLSMSNEEKCHVLKSQRLG